MSLGSDDVKKKKTGMSIIVTWANFCHDTDKGILMSHADYCQGVTDIGFQARSHGADIQLLGHLAALAIICQR